MSFLPESESNAQAAKYFMVLIKYYKLILKLIFQTKQAMKRKETPPATNANSKYSEIYPSLNENTHKPQSELKPEPEEYAIQFEGDEKKEITLNEPILTTIKRDISMIVIKLKYAMIPSLRGSEKAKKQLMHWDLWGPFLLTLLLSVTLSMRTHESSSTIITSIFFIMWVGSVVVYLNANFLGSHMSIFQSICLLGYCVFPINVVSLLTWLLGGFLIAPLKLTLVGISFVWSTLCSISFIGELIPERKRKLALYPIFLFYLFLSWFVLIV